MSELLPVGVLGRDEARSLTDEVKREGERLWGKLRELHDGRAFEALGYSSWHSYCEAEFGWKQAQAYRQLHAGQVSGIIQMDNAPKTEAVARELAPLLDDPEQLREAWAEVVADHPSPTATDVRDVVQGRLTPPRAPSPEQVAVDVTLSIADAVRYLDRDPGDAPKVAAMFRPLDAGIAREDWAPARFHRAGAFLAALTTELESELTT